MNKIRAKLVCYVFFRDKSFSRLNLVMRCPVVFIHLGSTDSDISANFMKSLKIWNSGNFSKIQETIGWNWDNHSTRLLHFYLLNSIVDKKNKITQKWFLFTSFCSIQYTVLISEKSSCEKSPKYQNSNNLSNLYFRMQLVKIRKTRNKRNS